MEANLCDEIEILISVMVFCYKKTAIRKITQLVSIVKSAHGNIGSKFNTTYMWNHSKLCTILPNLPSTCQYFVLPYEVKKEQNFFKINKV